MWAFGLTASGVLALHGLNTSAISKTNDKVDDHTGRIGTIEGKIERIPYIEGKLDTMLENRGIDPKQVDKIIEERLNLKFASTSQAKK